MEPLTELSQEGAGGGEPPGDEPLWTAVFEYEACGEDELSLRPGDVVQVLSRDSHVSGDEGWWTGKIDQRVGIFPSNYVSSGVQGGGPELRARYPPPPAIQRKGARARGGGLGAALPPGGREAGKRGRGPVPPPPGGLGWIWEGGRDRRDCRGCGGSRGSALPMSLGGGPGPSVGPVGSRGRRRGGREGPSRWRAAVGGRGPSWRRGRPAIAVGGERGGYGVSAPLAQGLP